MYRTTCLRHCFFHTGKKNTWNVGAIILQHSYGTHLLSIFSLMDNVFKLSSLKHKRLPFRFFFFFFFFFSITFALTSFQELSADTVNEKLFCFCGFPELHLWLLSCTQWQHRGPFYSCEDCWTVPSWSLNARLETNRPAQRISFLETRAYKSHSAKTVLIVRLLEKESLEDDGYVLHRCILFY